MHKDLLLTKMMFLSFFILFSYSAYAIDVIKTVTPISGGGKSTAYKNEVLLRALELSEEEFGLFSIKNTIVNMKPDRAIASMQSGDLINVAIIAANKEWDQKTIAIRTPIRGGTLSYRLLLANKEDAQYLSSISTLPELKKLVAGLQNDWSTTEIFKTSSIPRIISQNFEGLFLMLDRHRIDYIPRAIYEIFDELSSRNNKLENVMIAPNVALYIPMVSYIYVSPQEKIIAARLTLGLKKLTQSGELRRIFDKYYAKDIALSQLKGRNIIRINNPYFNDLNPLNTENIWELH